MSSSSSYNTYESEDETSEWLMSSEISVDDELSDQLTLLNGDEDCHQDSSFEALIKLSMRLKKQYNLHEAAVQLERCDKIWDTMQLVKQMQMDNEDETSETAQDENEEDQMEEKYTPPGGTLRLPEGANSSIPYIKYQPVQGNGNNALPNFYLAVKSQKKLYNCVTCGKQYSEERSLRLHSQKEHGVVMPKARKKSRRNADIKPAASQDSTEHKPVNNSSSKDRDNAKSRLFVGTSKHKTEQRKPERKSTESGSIALGEAKKEPEAKWADDTREKLYICSICSTAYSYQRSMTSHMMNVHNMTLEEANLVFREGDVVTTTKPRPSKKEICQKVDGIKRENVKKESAEALLKSRYIYTCKPCGKRFTEKTYLRAHASKIHDIVIPLRRNPPLSVIGKMRYYTHYTCEIKRPRDESSKTRVELTNKNDKSYVASITKDETQRPRTMRSGRLIGDRPNANRPRRACAGNTSYTECTKEEEEALQRELILSNTPREESAKPSNSQTTPCFLCKKAYVDIRKHLVDYHRINYPETILPLATNVVDEKDNEKDTVSLASSETIKSPPPESIVKTRKNRAKVKQTDVRLKNSNDYIRLLRKPVNSSWNPKRYECVLCCYKFNCRSHVQRHLDNHTINGVVQEHKSGKPRKRRKNLKARPVDPLALTDLAESSRSESQGNPTDEDEPQTTGGRKGINSVEDERLGSSYEHLNKRRKLEEPREFINPHPGSDSTSDSARYNNERETVLVMAEKEKTANPRDTRDSSDRDSGIGISITIKKCNNSYEVVEKDSGDDDKSKDFEHSKDDNTCSDSSSDVTPSAFINDHQEARRREILNSLDYSVEENVVESVRDDYVVLDPYVKESEEVSCSSDDKEANYCWKERETHFGKDACTSLRRGNVPSLRVMCTTLLKKDELTNLNCNHSISHQCPVCYRFYPTERDVTVHMLEHKVPRTDFRAIRVHAIPSSSLRRYGRRPL